MTASNWPAFARGAPPRHPPNWEQREAVSLLQAIEPQLRGFDGAPYGTPATKIGMGPPGSTWVDQALVGEAGPDHRVVDVEFARRDGFVSTDRAAYLPRMRPPVGDRWTFLLAPQPGGWTLVQRQAKRRWVPDAVAFASMAAVEQTSEYQRILKRFADKPYATRLAQRPLAPLPGRLGRWRGRGPLPDAPLPERQVKYTLEAWLPPGDHRFGDLYFDTRDQAESRVHATAPSLVWTVEFWEMPGPRYVHWHFHGTLARFIHCPATGEMLAHQRFIV